MRSTTTATSRLCVVLTAAALLTGCKSVPNQYSEDGPATTMTWESPTAAAVYAQYEPLEVAPRSDEELTMVNPELGTTHWPLYFEDPFVDKGHGRAGLNKYRLGWEDWVAAPYGYTRFTLNWMFFPASVVVTPPWTLMESDGKLSQQLLGYDHDATKSRHSALEPPAAE